MAIHKSHFVKYKKKDDMRAFMQRTQTHQIDRAGRHQGKFSTVLVVCVGAINSLVLNFVSVRTEGDRHLSARGARGRAARARAGRHDAGKKPPAGLEPARAQAHQILSLAQCTEQLLAARFAMPPGDTRPGCAAHANPYAVDVGTGAWSIFRSKEMTVEELKNKLKNKLKTIKAEYERSKAEIADLRPWLRENDYSVLYAIFAWHAKTLNEADFY